MEPKAPPSPRTVADQVDSAPRRPIRHRRGNLVPFDWASAPEFDALDAAVRLARRPNTARLMRAAPVPKGVLTLFRILGKAEEPTALAVRRLRRDPAFVRAVASFYVEHVLWSDNPDHYRVLGVARDAAQESIVENLRAALAWLVPYVGTDRWEGEYAAAVVAAGRAIGTEDDRMAHDLAAWSDLAASSSAPPPRKAIWRSAAVGIASLAWLVAMSGNFLASGVVDSPSAARPVEPPAAATSSASTEADPSIAVVRVQVVKGEDPVAVAPAPGPQPETALLPPSQEPPPDAAPIPLSGASTAAVVAAPDFDTAFLRDGTAPEDDEDGVATAQAEDQPAPPATTEQPSTVVATIEAPAAAVAAETASPLPALGSAMIARLDSDAEAAPAAIAKLSPAPRPPEPPKVLALPAKQAPGDDVVAAAPEAPGEAPVIEPAADGPPQVLASAEPPPAVTATPSFKCSRARTDVELAICADPALAAKDRELAQLYRQIRGSLSGSSRASATSRQMAWLKDRNSCGGSAACILSAYDARISELAAQPD